MNDINELMRAALNNDDQISGKEQEQQEQQQPTKKQPRKKILEISDLVETLTARGLKVRLNEISNAVEILGTLDGENADYTEQTIVPVLLSDLRTVYSGVTASVVADFLHVVATRNAYNPVLEHIDTKPWDGKPHIEHACDVLGIAPDDTLSRTLVHQFFKQGICLLHNTPRRYRGADGILVLVGPQGVGKTSFFEWIAMRLEWFRDGQVLDFRDKDTIRRADTTFIAELGEFESTARRDTERTKAFITSPFDEYRLPYARTDTQQPRRTSLCATCNSERFLIDGTGNRRYWIVKVPKRIERAAIESIDALGCWRQANAEVNGNYDGCRISGELIDQIEQRAAEYTQYERGEAEILDVLEDLQVRGHNSLLTVSEWMQENGIKGDAARVGRLLAKHGYAESKVRRVDGKSQRVRILPSIYAPPTEAVL